ncbi:hypothetical protein [Paenibacillus sp. 1P07SE]|uniref:hypothetical protein n=1 Tax=Paenibacillus sp. 1P07SE TaxID=3132209 RepID=UPI0039A6A81B
MHQPDGDLLRRIRASGLLKDPQWLDRLHEPVPLWVLLEVILNLQEKVEPVGRPYD